MTAETIISEIKKMPPEEQEKVATFCRELPIDADAQASKTRYMAADKAETVLKQVMDKNDELFRKLAR